MNAIIEAPQAAADQRPICIAFAASISDGRPCPPDVCDGEWAFVPPCVSARRAAEPGAIVMDSRTLRSTPQSGERAGYDGALREKGLHASRGRGHVRNSPGAPCHCGRHR